MNLEIKKVEKEEEIIHKSWCLFVPLSANYILHFFASLRETIF